MNNFYNVSALYFGWVACLIVFMPFLVMLLCSLSLMKAKFLLQWAYPFLDKENNSLDLGLGGGLGYAVPGALPQERSFRVCCAAFESLFQSIIPHSSLSSQEKLQEE